MDFTTGRTIALRNDPNTQQNIKTGIESGTWGSRFAGINADVKSGEHCIFLIGVSIANLKELKESEVFKRALSGFPNVKNENIDDQLLQNLQFRVEEVLYGMTTSDWYEDSSEIWPPKVLTRKNKKTGEEEERLDFYKNRFKWNFTHKETDLLITKDTFGITFIRSIVRSLRDKCVAPFEIHDSNKIETFKSNLSLRAASNEEDFQMLAHEAEGVSIPEGPREKPVKSNGNSAGRWSRNPNIASEALRNANYACEIDHNHTTFISQRTKRNYTEAHHLVPMEFQGQFKYSLDVPENIVSLCSNCHDLIHYAMPENKEKLVEKLYHERVGGLNSRKIEITLEEMKKLYGIPNNLKK